jgi:hypothetical protein
MITYNTLETAFGFGANNSFVAVFANYSGAVLNNTVQTAIAYENQQIPRQIISYDFSIDRINFKTLLVPPLITVSSTINTTFNTIFVLNLGAHTITNFVATWLNPTDATLSPSTTLLENTIFINRQTNSFSTIIAKQIGGISLQSSIGQPSLVACAGKIVLATYKYPKDITLLVNNPVKLKLGTITTTYL